jgi:hypothetical protein
MKYSTEERTFIRGIQAEAHRMALLPDGSIDVRAVPIHFVALLRESEGASPGFIDSYIDSLAAKGAAKVASDWRRSQKRDARTAAGTDLEVPAHAGIRRPDRNGTKVPVQVALGGMTVPELRSHKARLSASRNTLSREIRLLSDLIEVCESKGYATAEQALADLLEVA